MIHKFILGRCVQCNLPQEDLNHAGWECHGHTKDISKNAPQSSIAGNSRAPNVNERTGQIVINQKQGPAPNSESAMPSIKAERSTRSTGLGALIVASLVVILIIIGIAVHLDGPKIQTIANPDGLVVYNELETVQQVDGEVQNDITLNSVLNQVERSGHPEVLTEVVAAHGRAALNSVLEKYIRAGLVRRVPEYTQVSLRHGFKNYLGFEMVKLEVLNGPSAGFQGYAYDEAGAFGAADSQAKTIESRLEAEQRAERLARWRQSEVVTVTGKPEEPLYQPKQEPKSNDLNRDHAAIGLPRERRDTDQEANDIARAQVAREEAGSELSRRQLAGDMVREQAHEQAGNDVIPRQEVSSIDTEYDIREEDRKARSLYELSWAGDSYTGRTIEELMDLSDWKYPREARAAMDNEKDKRDAYYEEKFANDPKQLADYHASFELARVRREGKMQEEVEYQRQRAINPGGYPDRYRHFLPEEFESWKRFQEHKRSGKRSSVVLKALPVESASPEKLAGDLVTAFLKHGEDPDIQIELADYAATVKPYFDQGSMDKQAILKDLADYRAKWPERSLMLVTIESANLDGADKLDATYRLQYTATDGKRHRAGVLVQRIHYTLTAGRWLVSGIQTVERLNE